MIRRGFFIISFVFLMLFFVNFSCSEELRVTEEHPFYLNGKWVSARDLEVGDTFKTLDSKIALIKSVEVVELKVPFFVYNLEVPFFNNFVVGFSNLIVHNSNLDSEGLVSSFQNGRVEISKIRDVDPSVSGLSGDSLKKFDAGELTLGEVGQLTDAQRLAYAEKKLGRALTSDERKAILAAHYSEPEVGRIFAKSNVLKEGGITNRDDWQVLMDNGIVGKPPRYSDPKVVMPNARGMDLETSEIVYHNIYDSVGESNIDQLFTADLSHVGENLYGTKAVAYVDNNGQTHFGFFTESVQTHHPHIGAQMAEVDSTWSKETLDSFFRGTFDAENPSPQIRQLLEREFGFDFMVDKSTGQIVQVRMDSGITGAQRVYQTKLNRKLVEDVVIEMFERIDPKLLHPKYRDLKWMDDPNLYQEIIPRALNIQIIIPFLI